MKCSLKGCAHDAVWIPELRVPSDGGKLQRYAALYLLINLPMCEDHKDTPTAKEFVEKPEQQFPLIQQMHGLGRGAPDFAGATIQMLPLDDPKVTKFFDMLKGQNLRNAYTH